MCVEREGLRWVRTRLIKKNDSLCNYANRKHRAARGRARGALEALAQLADAGRTRTSRFPAEPEETKVGGAGIRLDQGIGGLKTNQITRAAKSGLDVSPRGCCLQPGSHANAGCEASITKYLRSASRLRERQSNRNAARNSLTFISDEVKSERNSSFFSTLFSCEESAVGADFTFPFSSQIGPHSKIFPIPI